MLGKINLPISRQHVSICKKKSLTVRYFAYTNEETDRILPIDFHIFSFSLPLAYGPTNNFTTIFFKDLFKSIIFASI